MRPGWLGDPPANDDDAIRRILDAAHRCIERDGDVGIAEVAREVGVTRPTVYRYFRSTDDLVVATATDDAASFLTRLQRHLGPLDLSPTDALVEGVAFTLERLPNEPSLGLLLNPGRIGKLSRDFTSPTAIALGRSVFMEWERMGLSEEDLDQLVEHVLRMIQSFVIDPGTPPRTGSALRAYLDRWLRPGVEALASQVREPRT
jgi:AcrR family transcriptional regulator